ncbi:MAG: phosphate acyltransferase PlsX [Bacteroidia bacterium]|nr:phosphate acyltransferase PlsX [Bacteroidia bacterium]HQU99883.1 phosphate acyltransferase PlsX [Bacteroidia bacterium]
MRIGLDIMGGDYAPLEITLGALLAQPLLTEVRLVLIGSESAARKIITENQGNPANFDFVNSIDVIEMHEHPAKAFQQKPNSSISIGFHLLKEGKIDAFCSAGNTGAMLVGSMFSVKTIQGIMRPAISTLVPKEKGGYGLLLDVGVNADCKPENLQQFAMLGSLYAEHVCHIPNPKVALMSIGEEDEKGNVLTQAANQLLKNTSGINFVGNVEGRDLFNDKADVIVCDGFTGNIMLKLAESFYSLTTKRKLKDEYFDKFNFESYGGTPILGVNGTVMIAHGISNATAVKAMLVLTHEVVAAQLPQKIASAIASQVPQANQ